MDYMYGIPTCTSGGTSSWQAWARYVSTLVMSVDVRDQRSKFKGRSSKFTHPYLFDVVVSIFELIDLVDILFPTWLQFSCGGRVEPN